MRPLLVTRLANATLGAVVTALAAALALDPSQPDPGTRIVGVVGVVTGLLLMWRGTRLRVRCRDGVVHVHGWLRTRAVPVRSVIEVTDFPALVWVTPSGRRHWTPLIAFAAGPDVVAFVRAHNVASIHRLRAWIGAGG